MERINDTGWAAGLMHMYPDGRTVTLKEWAIERAAAEAKEAKEKAARGTETTRMMVSDDLYKQRIMDAVHHRQEKNPLAGSEDEDEARKRIPTESEIDAEIERREALYK